MPGNEHTKPAYNAGEWTYGKQIEYTMTTKEAQQIDEIALYINEHKYNDLGEFLRDCDWEIVGEALIDPKTVRTFVKEIEDKEVRLDTMRFLKKYARQYFRQAAENVEYKEHVRVATSTSLVRETVKSADENLQLFVDELGFLIEQLESSGEFTGDKFKKQAKRIEQLEEENKEYKNANKYLQEKVDRFENPHKYGKFIPAELNNRKFVDIMQYLQSKQLVLPLYPEKDYTRGISCYQWYGSCALFGYFVWKLNQEFDLNEARDLLNWQVFETAINNYDKLINEGRKAVSKFRKDEKMLLPAKADRIEDAIKYANGELK